MATVFWIAKGINSIDYFQRDKTITAKYYARLLQHLKDEVQKNERNTFAEEKTWFLDDNASVHMLIITKAKINELKFELFFHPSYSLNLFPSYYHLFPDLKKWHESTKFGDN